MNDDMRIVSEASPTRRLIFNRLTQGIMFGRFKPGERLIERELCEMLGVSRTSLREALRELERDGLIENIPNKGPIVARITPEQAQSLYEVRAVLEGLAARLFAQRATDAQVQQLEVRLEDLGKSFERFTPEGFFTAADAFYATLMEGARNETLSSSLRALHTRISQMRLVSLQRAGRSDVTMKELRRLVRKIKARDAEGAEQESIRHVSSAAGAAAIAVQEAESKGKLAA